MQTIDKEYQVIRALGQGLAGEVFLVQKGTQKLALKLLKQAIANLSSQEATAHFKAEFSILKQLSHPHIAKILDFGTDAATGRHYYTSEFVEGDNIYAATRKLNPEQIEDFFVQALRALEYLHSHRIPHFDLKPENLLIHQGKQVKLIDFGMAGFKPRGQLAGTPAYMAPEIVMGNSPDTRADLYSLGVTFYECVTGGNPFAAKSLAEMLRRQETLQAPPARQVQPKLSAAFSEILEQLLKKNPAERPASAGNALRSFAQLSGKKISLETEATSLSYLPNETKLIGRKEVLAAFQRSFDAVFQAGGAEPHGHCFVIVGAGGLGKTRLLKEIRFRSQLAGVRTLSPATPELPELQEATCLLYDDLSAEAIRQLSWSLLSAKLPILLVATSSEAVVGAESLDVQTLTPFQTAEIRDYLSALTALADPPAALVTELERRTKGSPRFLTEVLEEVIRRGALFDENGRWTAATIEDLGIDFSGAQASERLEASFQEDFQKLDQPAQRLLGWMALSPTALTADFLQEVAGEEDLHYWMLELLNQGYLRRDEAAQTYPIANPYFKAWVQKILDPKEAATRHAAFAKILQGREPKRQEWRYHLGRSGPSPEAREALVDLARELSRKARFAEALENLLLAEAIPTEDVEAAVTIQLKVSEQLLALKRFPEALARLDALQDRVKRLPNDPKNIRLKVWSYEHIGAAYLLSNALEKAKGAFYAELALCDSSDEIELWNKLVFQNYLGRIHMLEGNYSESAEILQKSWDQWKQQVPEAQQRLVNNNPLGEVLKHLGRLDEARKVMLEDLEFFRKVGDEARQADFFYNLGDLEFTAAHYDKSVEYFKKCVQVSKEQKNFQILLRAYNGLGNLYHTRQEYEDSRHYYERALAIAQKTNDFQSQAGIEINLGGILNAVGRPQESVPHLKVAINLLHSMGLKGAYEKFFMALAKLELGEVYRKLKKFEESRDMLRDAWSLAEEQESLAGKKAAIRMELAKLYLDQGRSSEAEEIIKELRGNELTAPEKIEFAKLENLFASGPEAAAREPAVTQGSMEYPRAAQSSIFVNPVAESEYAKLLQLTRFINAETNLDFVLKSVLQYALELSGAERGLILLLDEHDHLEVRASINTSVSPNLTEISSKVAEQALRSGEMVESDDATQDGRFNEYQSVMILKLRSILCLPISSRNKTVGVLYLDHRYRPGAFHKGRYPLLHAFCDQAGIAIENAKLFEAYERAQAELKQRLQQAEEEVEHYHELLGEGAGMLPTKYAYDNIVSRSKPMYEVFKLLDKITETNISVFINGETGTGKELIAKALHYNNKQRAKARFVAINCGGIPPNLIESELFGYKAGAFTGASKDKKGLFVEADGGTIFMDEVAELEMGLQVKLLRALQEGEVIPVGDSKPVKFDARVVSASHKNLESQIAQGLFREDLFYRVCQIRIPLPPLRDRREDIPLLAERFAANYAKEHGLKKTPKLSGNLIKRLLDYDWPGNIRELENTIRVACALAEGGELTAKSLPESFGRRQATAHGRLEATASSIHPARGAAEEHRGVRLDAGNGYDTRRTWEDYEKVIFAKAYAAADFKPLAAAQLLDVSMATFYKRIKDFNLNDKSNSLFQDPFVLAAGKTLRDYLEDVVWAAYLASDEKAYTAIKWLDVSQGHFYNVLKKAKERQVKPAV